MVNHQHCQRVSTNLCSNDVRKYLILLIIAIAVFCLILSSRAGNEIDAEMPPNCIFCDIANGREPKTKLEVETDEFVIFKDIKPASTHHYLIVPKKHFDSLKVLNATHDEMVQRMDTAMRDFLKKKGVNLSDALIGFHLPPFISVNHLHMHGIAPRSDISFIYRYVFKPGTSWFKTTEESREYIRRKEL